MRGSGLHHRIGSPSENHGNMPWRYASSRRSPDRSAPAASKPFGSLRADWTGGKGAARSRPGIIPPSALHLLPAVLRPLAHYSAALHDPMCVPPAIGGGAGIVFSV